MFALSFAKFTEARCKKSVYIRIMNWSNTLFKSVLNFTCRKCTFILLFCIFSLFINSLTKTKTKRSLFIYFRYKGCLYTKSDIHISDKQNYNFTLYKVKASNFPIRKAQDIFSFNSPYNFRIGYNINDRYAVSIGIDHMKYKTILNQDVHINGYIKNKASATYAANYNDSTIRLGWDFFYMEHSDGLNYISVEGDYTFYKLKLFKDFLSIDFTAGLGFGVMLPRTENYLFQQGANHPYHLSGFGMDIHLYPKIYISRFFFLQPSTKFGFIDMPDVYVDTHLDTKEKLSQHFFFFQWNLVVGANLPLSKQELKMRKRIKPTDK